MTYALEIATSRPRAGRMFEPIQERALHADALNAARGLPGALRGLIVVPEFAGPLGVPDFTAFVGDIAKLRVRQSLEVPAVSNEIDAGILSAAHVGRASTSGAIAASLAWPSEMVRARVGRLTGVGALVQTSKSKYVRAASIEPHGRLYAIEAKVGDWRSALRQARTYRVWADAYVIVMTGLSARTRADLTSEVLRDQGGLVVDGAWVARPRLGAVSKHRKLQSAELFAAATKSGLDDPALRAGVHP